jgi:hypothetical protein
MVTITSRASRLPAHDPNFTDPIDAIEEWGHHEKPAEGADEKDAEDPKNDRDVAHGGSPIKRREWGMHAKTSRG